MRLLQAKITVFKCSKLLLNESCHQTGFINICKILCLSAKGSFKHGWKFLTSAVTVNNCLDGHIRFSPGTNQIPQ